VAAIVFVGAADHGDLLVPGLIADANGTGAPRQYAHCYNQ
jgi:hypothetical protein